MKNNYLSLLRLLTVFLCILFLHNKVDGQTSDVILPDSAFTGDILHADAGSDFIGIIFTRNGSICYNRIGYDGVWAMEDSLGVSTEGKMEIDGTDRVHVVFTTSGKIAYKVLTGSVWSEPVYIESNNGGACSKPDIAVDADGNAHISYSDRLGDTGGQMDKDDIMYATNKSGSFVKSMIFRGYYENWGGSAYYGEYLDKGSRIAVNTNGKYFIAAHYQLFDRSSGGTAVRTYMIKVHSELGSGNTVPVSSTDIFDLYDLVPGDNVSVLYKQTTLKTARLDLSGTDISFTGIQDISASLVNSAADNGNFLAVTGKTNENLFTTLNGLSHIYTNLQVKGTTVPIAAIDGLFYAIFTDNADSKIKMQVIADSLSFTTFSLPGQTGPAVINPADHTVQIKVAAGTIKSDLVATFLTTSDAVSVKIDGTDQVSGITHNDYSSPVTYTLVYNETKQLSWQVSVIAEPSVYTIATQISPADAGTVTGGGDYTEGSEATVIATAGEGYGFMNWTENGSEVSSESEYTFTVTADRNLTANFIKQYALTIQISGDGLVEVNDVAYSGTLMINSGTSVLLEALEAGENHFTGWTGDLVSADASESVIMDSDKEITAGFAINEYTLTINITGEGSVNVNGNTYTEAITVNSGTILDLDAIAGDGYIFTGWSGDLNSSEAEETITMQNDRTVGAVFEISSGIQNNLADGIDVYPNPFSGIIHIKTSGEVNKVIISTMNGQNIKTFEMNGRKHLNAGDLSKGIYLMDIWLSNGGHIIKKIIRE